MRADDAAGCGGVAKIPERRRIAIATCAGGGADVDERGGKSDGEESEDGKEKMH